MRVNDRLHYERSVVFEFANMAVSAAVSREMLERIRSEAAARMAERYKICTL
jgi:hypothetical protein